MVRPPTVSKWMRLGVITREHGPTVSKWMRLGVITREHGLTVSKWMRPSGDSIEPG